MVRVVALAMCTLVGTVAAQGAADEDRAAAKRELLRERASRRLEEHVDPAGWGGADAGWDAAFFAEPVPVVLGQPMVDNLFINPYPFYSFDATAGQQFHIGVNDISVGDTGLWIYDTDRTTLLAEEDDDNCGVSMTGSACTESVDCDASDEPLCGGYAEEAVFTAPADGTYYAMGHSLSVYGSSGFDYRVFAPGGAYQYNGPWDTLAADADITDLAGLSLTVRTWPPPEPRLPLTQTINCDMKTALPTHNLGSFCLDFFKRTSEPQASKCSKASIKIVENTIVSKSWSGCHY